MRKEIRPKPVDLELTQLTGTSSLLRTGKLKSQNKHLGTEGLLKLTDIY